jgi:hypothetical protein
MEVKVTTKDITTTKLDDLAKRIKACHAEFNKTFKMSLIHAMDAGDLLLAAKTSPDMKHGQWLPWLEQHCAMAVRTAQLYMRLASKRPEIEDQIRKDAYLTISGALTAIAPPSSKDIDWEAVDYLLDAFANRMNNATRQHLLSGLRKAYKESWGLVD